MTPRSGDDVIVYLCFEFNAGLYYLAEFPVAVSIGLMK